MKPWANPRKSHPVEPVHVDYSGLGGLPPKRLMEEAAHVVCPECGSADGRHLRVCTTHTSRPAAA